MYSDCNSVLLLGTALIMLQVPLVLRETFFRSLLIPLAGNAFVAELSHLYQALHDMQIV